MSRKSLPVDDFSTSLIPRYANDTTVLSLDLTEEEFVAVRCSANDSCLSVQQHIIVDQFECKSANYQRLFSTFSVNK